MSSHLLRSHWNVERVVVIFFDEITHFCVLLLVKNPSAFGISPSQGRLSVCLFCFVHKRCLVQASANDAFIWLCVPSICVKLNSFLGAIMTLSLVYALINASAHTLPSINKISFLTHVANVKKVSRYFSNVPYTSAWSNSIFAIQARSVSRCKKWWLYSSASMTNRYFFMMCEISELFGKRICWMIARISAWRSSHKR